MTEGLPSPAAATGSTKVENQTFHQPIQVVGGVVAPSHGLYQPAFTLGEADFLRLTSSSPWLTAAGSAAISFGLSYLLPLVVRVWFPPTLVPGSAAPAGVAKEDWVVAGATIGIGAVVLVLGLFFSRNRRRVLKRIEEHFANNPAELEYRVKP